MYSDVITLLKSMGLSVESDDPALLMCYNAASERIRNYINWPTIPDDLQTALAYLTVAEYLKYAKGANKLQDADGNDLVDFSEAVKSMSEGDTSVSYAVGANEGTSTQEQRLDAFISHLTEHVRTEALKFRKLVW